MKPDAATYNPDPAYLRGLVAQTGLSVRGVAWTIGISERLLRYYLAPESAAGRRVMPYPTQFALEALAAALRRIDQ